MFRTTELQQEAFISGSLLWSHLFCLLLQGDLEQLCYGLLLYSSLLSTAFQREERGETDLRHGSYEAEYPVYFCYYQGAWPDFPRPIV